MQVIVLGTLGDLVKKICELESADREPSRDNTLQMVTYRAVFEQWAVLDPDELCTLVSRFKVQLIRFRIAEAAMKFLLDNLPERATDKDILKFVECSVAAKRYVAAKEQLLGTYHKLNKLGSHERRAPFAVTVPEVEEVV